MNELTPENLAYMRDRLDDVKQNIRAHEQNIVHFPAGELHQMLVLLNVLTMILKP